MMYIRHYELVAIGYVYGGVPGAANCQGDWVRSGHSITLTVASLKLLFSPASITEVEGRGWIKLYYNTCIATVMGRFAYVYDCCIKYSYSYS